MIGHSLGRIEIQKIQFHPPFYLCLGLQRTCSMVIMRLNNKETETGATPGLESGEAEASLALWKARHLKVQYVPCCWCGPHALRGK